MLLRNLPLSKIGESFEGSVMISRDSEASGPRLKYGRRVLRLDVIWDDADAS